MSETPKAGESWFRKTTLTVVEVCEGTFGGTHRVAINGDLLSRSFTTADFLRDYARNVPVTAELLEGVGWFNTNCDSEYGVSWDFPLDPAVASRLVVDVAANVVTRAFLELHGPTGRTLGYRQLATPHTLRDLLNTLRILGVSTEAVSHEAR